MESKELAKRVQVIIQHLLDGGDIEFAVKDVRLPANKFRLGEDYNLCYSMESSKRGMIWMSTKEWMTLGDFISLIEHMPSDVYASIVASKVLSGR